MERIYMDTLSNHSGKLPSWNHAQPTGDSLVYLEQLRMGHVGCSEITSPTFI
jgi:hypothetical protein